MDPNDLSTTPPMISQRSTAVCLSDSAMQVWLSALHQMALADGDFDPSEQTYLQTHLQAVIPMGASRAEAWHPPSRDALHRTFADKPILAEQFLRSAVLVALADGHLSEEELVLLQQWKQLLGCAQSPINNLQIADGVHGADGELHSGSSTTDLLATLKSWLDQLDPTDPRVAAFIVSLIPAQCPFERDIVLFGHKLVHIPPMCKLNPLYDQLVGLRFRCLGHLSEEQQLRIARNASAGS